MEVKTITAGVLKVAYHDYGPADGWPCIMCHWELGRTPTRQCRERVDRFIRDMPDVADV